MDMRYGQYCLADPDFYERLDLVVDTQSRFSVTRRPTPTDWRRTDRHIWVELAPCDATLPMQGWKVHISGTLDNADEILRITWEYCLEHRVAFKYVRSAELLAVINAKYASRTSSGKLVTIYPCSDDQLELVVTDLAAALDGYDGPYILSDFRWHSGPLYLRYGAFFERYCISNETGEPVAAIEGPDGKLGPDVRQPVFQLPPWAKVPNFVNVQLAARFQDTDANTFPYAIEKALHFSNGGGVYLAHDERTGQRVIIREARPLAGLDSNGLDAVTRLRRERSVMEQLNGSKFAPRLLDYFTFWEHEFLVEEYVDAKSLQECITERHPLILREVSQAQLAEYTEWAFEILDELEQALNVLHRLGFIYGDLHWHNVLVKPDGHIVLVDFEIATNLADACEPGLGAPGFVSRERRQGMSVDDYALACMGLILFLPLSFLLDKDPTKAVAFVRYVVDRFPVPRSFGAKLLQGLGTPTLAEKPEASVMKSSVGKYFESDVPNWHAITASLVKGIHASATPERGDRLFPGDIEQFRDGGFTLAHGAAGVLYAFETVGVRVDPVYIDWLIAASRGALFPRAGLYNGLHGVVYVLSRLGQIDDALTVFDRALALSAGVRTIDLFGGHAGIVLNLLYLARATGDASLQELALERAELVSRALRSPTMSSASLVLPGRAGLMHGYAGPALMFIHLYEQTNDETFLDAAEHAIRLDLERCEITPDDTLQVRDAPRVIAYLATGSAGIGIVLHRYLKHRIDDEFAEAQSRIQKACQAEFSLESGLFRGRAGFIAYLRYSGFPPGHPVIERHLRRLGWHAVPHQGEIAFPGEYLLRLSMDLATGSAGVLLAINVGIGSTMAFLPFLDGVPGWAADRSRRKVLQRNAERG